jgi:hypothetical protein
MDTMTGRRTPVPTESGAERIARREAHRTASMEEARAAAKGSHKGHVPAAERVEQAAEKLAGTNVAQAIGLIREARPEEQDFLLLAEAAGQNRKTVIGSFPKPREAARKAYEQPEGGLVARDQTPPSATASEDSERE